MITKKEWDKFQDLEKELAEITDKITDHITEVLHMLFEVYGSKLDYWHFEDAPEGDVGTMQVFGGTIGPIVSHPIQEKIVYKDNYPATDFPVEFLFMSVDEIKKEITRDRDERRKAEEEKKKKAKEKREKRKAEKERLKQSAVQKLTKEERKALGLK